MKKEDRARCNLPTTRIGLIVQGLDAVTIAQIVLIGAFIYLAVPLSVSILEWKCSHAPVDTWVKSGSDGVGDFGDVLYFNLITILTIGYGDYVPNGTGARFLSVVEALAGTGIVTVTLSALIAKFLAPPKDAVVFSKYAYYCTESQKFLVIYLNTTRNRIINADQSAYFKLQGNWSVTSAFRSPLVTPSVQTFYAARVPEAEIVDKLDTDHPDDALDLFRFGISGQIGGGAFSVAIEYDPTEIIVLPNRDLLKSYAGFWDVNLKDPEFQQMFHYRPDDAPTLIEYVQNRRMNKPMPSLQVGQLPGG